MPAATRLTIDSSASESRPTEPVNHQAASLIRMVAVAAAIESHAKRVRRWRVVSACTRAAWRKSASPLAPRGRGAGGRRGTACLLALRLLFEFGIDQVVEGKDLVPLLLCEQLALLDHDVVQRFPGLVALACDFRALLVTERGLEHRDDAERVQHHVAGVFGVRGHAVDAVHTQA